MFTVKYRESAAMGGAETLYTAREIKVIWPGPARTLPAGGEVGDHRGRINAATSAARLAEIARFEEQLTTASGRQRIEIEAQIAALKLHGDAEQQPAGGCSTHVDGASNYFEAGIYLDPEPQYPQEPGAPPPPLCATNVILFGGSETSSAEARRSGKVWVMNEAGATVATYDL